MLQCLIKFAQIIKADLWLGVCCPGRSILAEISPDAIPNSFMWNATQHLLHPFDVPGDIIFPVNPQQYRVLTRKPANRP
ncbi:hypothetical protein D1872_196190 [compost metagenome]